MLHGHGLAQCLPAAALSFRHVELVLAVGVQDSTQITIPVSESLFTMVMGDYLPVFTQSAQKESYVSL